MPAGMTEHRIDVDGGTVFAVEIGSGTPLLMLHGWPLDHRMFDYQVDALSGAFRCIAIDRRGFGRSTAPPDMRREPGDIDRVLFVLFSPPDEKVYLDYLETKRSKSGR